MMATLRSECNYETLMKCQKKKKKHDILSSASGFSTKGTVTEILCLNKLSKNKL